MKVWLNNRLADANKAKVSVYDHGYLYGDGIYETVHAYSGRVFHWPEHYRRLRNSARRISLRCPWSSAYLLNAIERVLKANRQPNASVRITISRGPGPLGLSTRRCTRPTLVMTLLPPRPLQQLWKNGIFIGIVDIRRNHPQCLDPQIKATSQLNTILGKMEAERLGVFEGILLNLEGYLAEGTISNIFFSKNGTIYTPELSCGILQGVTREAVITLARRNGFRVHEGRYAIADLRRADEIFLTSTTLEVISVVSVRDPRRWKVGNGRPGPIARRLHELFQAQVRRELGV